MDDQVHLDESIFKEDESLKALMNRPNPIFDLSDAAIKTNCRHSSIPIHSERNEVTPLEVVIFDILVDLMNIEDEQYVSFSLDQSITHTEA
jgi:hypothetical protein